MVRLIEKVNPDDIRVKKMSVDGIQNTIKYEIKSQIKYEDSKKLTVEAELSAAIETYTINHPEIAVVLKSVSADEVRIVVTVDEEVKVDSDFVVDMLSEIFDDCKYIN